MEAILAQRPTSILKCVVLFLFIFTAKVLTSRPQDVQDLKSIQQGKSSHYIRTFTKYHHRRTNRNVLPEWVDQPKVIQKRSLDTLDSSEFITNNLGIEYDPIPERLLPKIIKKRSVDISDSSEFIYKNVPDRDISLNQLVSNTLRDNIVINNAISSNEKGSKNDLKTNEVKKYKDKEVVTTTSMPGILESRITCLYKTNHMVMRVTPSYEDEERNAQFMVENDGFDIGPISESTLPSGEKVQLEHCTDPKAYCYTLWHQNTDGNLTVLGQGCWRGAASGGCIGCTRVTPRLPATLFCCCHTALCNQHFASLQEVTVSMKVESPPSGPSYVSAATSGALTLTACLLIILALSRRCLTKRQEAEPSKGDVMGSGPDALATGLLCVDNLTLIEHIGQGKFGSVWRGTLGSTPVAVKLYSNVNAWQKEAAIYALPQLSHCNLLRYYGSDTRQSLTETSTREHLIVLELCTETLRSRLEKSPVTWIELATLAHGLASALAHLHTPSGNKPCIVHRDLTSRNVLCVNGTARLADLGLAQPLTPRNKRDQPPTTITEAGTLRYLSPEALEGALDLSEARAALCAVDVFALGLVLWELLWRCRGAHHGPTPPYAPPYHHSRLPNHPTLLQMQSLVARNKARPPLPAGPGTEPRALRVMSDTCDECWDHDAEARLTAVCVEERMSELKQMLQTPGPVVHDNNLHPSNSNPTSVEDKNSNCTQANNYDVTSTTPLLYPHPHIGRNACIERNTHNNIANPVELIHKSLKDISVPIDQPRVQNIEENCLSVARGNHMRTVLDFENSERLNEIRSYQRPLDYVPNDVSNHNEDRRPKETNLLHDIKVEKPKWGIRKFFERKLNMHSKPLETEVKLLPEVNNVQNKIKTSIVNEKRSNLMYERPANLILNDNGMYNFEVPCTLSPPNRTLSPNMMLESGQNRVFNFKELPQNENEPKTQHQVFAVIVPKAKPQDLANLIEMQGTNSSESKHSIVTSMSSQSIFKSGHSESSDSTKKCLSDIKISNSASSSRASINLELQYIEGNMNYMTNLNDSPFDINTDCSSSDDDNLMLLSENGGSKITMQTIPKEKQDVLKESHLKTELGLNKINKYTNFDNEYSDPNDKENLVNYSGDNPVYIATLNGEIDNSDLKILPQNDLERSPKPNLKNLAIKRQHSLEQVGEIFSSSGDLNLQSPAGRVKTPGDIPVAIRRARSRALQKSRTIDSNRLSLYDDRMMFGNSL